MPLKQKCVDFAFLGVYNGCSTKLGEINMRNYETELKKRIEFIRERLAEARADGIVFGNSGGKDSALVGILCKLACDNTVGIIMPCSSKVNFTSDMDDGLELAKKFNIETRTVDLTEVKIAAVKAIAAGKELNKSADTNIAPRLRMLTLYTVGANENRLVAGTGNRCERFMGYFTKWGDGACDFNPIGDLKVSEVYEFLRYLGAPQSIIEKAPSAGLFEGQTDEAEMGVTYAAVEDYIEGKPLGKKETKIIERYNRVSAHKRKMPPIYGE